jgi:hypothetical protein
VDVDEAKRRLDRYYLLDRDNKIRYIDSDQVIGFDRIFQSDFKYNYMKSLPAVTTKYSRFHPECLTSVPTRDGKYVEDIPGFFQKNRQGK